jgi:hypothetical protein
VFDRSRSDRLPGDSVGMMATSARPPDRQSRQLYALVLVEAVSFIGLNVSGLLVVTEVSHNARPFLSTTWCLLTAAILGSLVALELQIAADYTEARAPLNVIRRLAFAILGFGSLTLLATLLTMLTSQPDPSLYRVPSAVAAASQSAACWHTRRSEPGMSDSRLIRSLPLRSMLSSTEKAASHSVIRDALHHLYNTRP